MHKQHKREQAPTMMRRRSLTSAIAITLALGIAGPTFAQEAATAAAPQATGPSADPQQQPQELETITVTANKREENIREVAVAITKLTDEQLENINATQMTDYANYVPGLAVQSLGTLWSAMGHATFFGVMAGVASLAGVLLRLLDGSVRRAESMNGRPADVRADQRSEEHA